MKRTLTILLLSILSVSLGASVQFSAKETLYQGKKIGEVQGNGLTVMRLLSKEGALSPYGRAQVVAERLSQRITALTDFEKIRFSYPNDIYTAILDKDKLFSIYPEEVAANGSTPESLMSDWINNIKRIVAQGPKPIRVVQEIQGTSNLAESVVSNQVEEALQDQSFVEQERLKREVALLRAGLKSLKRQSSSPILPISLMVSFFFVGVLGFLYWRVNKKLGSLGVLEKTNRLEELENSVSTLMRELHETSDNVTEKAKAVLGELDKKLIEAKTLSIPEQRPVAEIPEPLPIEKEPKREPQMILEEPVPQPVEPPPIPVVDKPERSLAEQLADEIEHTEEAASETAESLFLDDDMDPDLKSEIESILANDSMTKNEKVVALTSVGTESAEVARYLNMGKGEVDLILQLTK